MAHFVLILVVPLDKGGSVSPNITCSLHFTPHRKETTSPEGERAAALETNLQLVAEDT